jgi:hypothetical protein
VGEKKLKCIYSLILLNISLSQLCPNPSQTAISPKFGRGKQAKTSKKRLIWLQMAFLKT